MNRKIFISALIALAAGTLLAGCFLVPRHRGIRIVVPAPVVQVHYQPMQYHGNVVYYSSAGLPFYYSSGVRVFVPVHQRSAYTVHFRKHKKAYHKWNRHNHRRGHR
jgi:hypothetical protein